MSKLEWILPYGKNEYLEMFDKALKGDDSVGKLEEIKGRYDAWDPRLGLDDGDVEYLLSKLEEVEKALESANDKLILISSKDLKNGQLRYEASTIIQEALQQLRQ